MPGRHAAALAVAPPPRRPPGTRSNVLLITIDTLRADHLGAYGYRRPTSPRIDALAARGTLFERAYTFWPKTRGSFVMMMTGRRPSQNGYSKSHPVIVGFNPTLASVLQAAGYATAAVVDNPNVAAQHGYAKGFDRYRETWEEKALAHRDGPHAGHHRGRRSASCPGAPGRQAVLPLAALREPPHARTRRRAPYDTAFLDAAARKGPRLPGGAGLPRRHPQGHGRCRARTGSGSTWRSTTARSRPWTRRWDGSSTRLDASGRRGHTLVVLTSDHGESLGEHDYYFDHGENLFDPSLAIPLIVSMPGSPPGVRTAALASTLDLVPTVLDAVKVSYPPGPRRVRACSPRSRAARRRPGRACSQGTTAT